MKMMIRLALRWLLRHLTSRPLVAAYGRTTASRRSNNDNDSRHMFCIYQKHLIFCFFFKIMLLWNENFTFSIWHLIPSTNFASQPFVRGENLTSKSRSHLSPGCNFTPSFNRSRIYQLSYLTFIPLYLKMTRWSQGELRSFKRLRVHCGGTLTMNNWGKAVNRECTFIQLRFANIESGYLFSSFIQTLQGKGLFADTTDSSLPLLPSLISACVKRVEGVGCSHR